MALSHGTTLAALLVGAALTFPAHAQQTASNLPVLPAGPSGPQLAKPCNRACLNAFVDKYLDALVAHDPSRLPLSDDVKFTENTVRLNLGEALWSTATGIGDYKIYIADPVTGQAGFLGVILERGEPRLLTLRLKIKNDKITEVETIVTREGLMGKFQPEMATRTAKPIWAQTVAPKERVSREEMLKVANLYFEGMEQNTGNIIPFDDSCNRTENGLQTTNNPKLPALNGVNFGAMGCKEQFNHGGVGIYSTPERRWWMVDEERGIVIGIFAFTVRQTLTTIPIAEMFKIKNGRIYEIEAAGIAGAGMPYGSRSGW